MREKLSELLCLDVHGMLIILKALSARRGWLAKSQNDLKSKGVKFNPRFQATVVVMGTMLDDITCGRIPIEEGRWKYHLTDGIGAEKTCGALLMQNCCSSSCRSNLSNPCGPGSTNWPKLKPTCLLGSNCKPQQRLLFLQEIWTWTIIFLETKTKFQESSLVPSVFVSRALFGFFAREAAKKNRRCPRRAASMKFSRPVTPFDASRCSLTTVTGSVDFPNKGRF